MKENKETKIRELSKENKIKKLKKINLKKQN